MENTMWYFAWILGIGFAVLLAIVNAVWLEYGQDRIDAFGPKTIEDAKLKKTPKQDPKQKKVT